MFLLCLIPQKKGRRLNKNYRYPLYVNIFKRDLMDSHRETMIGIERQGDKEVQLELQDASKQDVDTKEAKPVEIPEKN